MPSFFRSAAAVAFAGVAFANPLPSSSEDTCLAVVTGKAALGDDSLRKEHCSSFIKTIVTPSAVTVTTTITDAPKPSSSGWGSWKRDVTVCPNEVPNYASACDESHYKSACSVWGVSGETTYTIPATTTTKTVYVGGSGKGDGNGSGNGNGNGNGNGGVCTSTVLTSVTKTGCSGGVTTSTVTQTSTVTSAAVTVTKAVETVTVTVGGNGNGNSTSGTPTGTNPGPTGKCISDSKAQEFVDAFSELLEYTSYNGTQGPPGRGYHYNTSAKYLAEDFMDYSDSINWMAGFPLGTVTFPSRAAFDYGQGILQPELKMTTLLVSHNCNTVTFKWSAGTPSNATVQGINHMILTDDLTQIKTNHAEFNNAAWLYSFGLQCKVPSTTSSKRSVFE